MSPPEKFKAAWEAEQEASAAKIQDLLRDGRELVALLRRCRPFVWRAMGGDTARERGGTMSASDFPPGCECTEAIAPYVVGFVCNKCRAIAELGHTREEYTTMRAAYERCPQGDKIPHAQDKVDAEALWPLIEGMDK
jgi:hypothetical protein